MTRGTTPTHILTLKGVDLSRITSLYVTYKQNSKDEPVITKCLADKDGSLVIDLDEGVINVYLSQADTLLFDADDKIAHIQVRGIIDDTQVFASGIADVPVRPILMDGEIS